ncbi:MAG: DNA translocase FtsK 4TM domain-containing protein [Pseudomonadota bacterium]|nr:DNA translocase FtsK 4TM domain-containing protein [Pseudomonadota bacterium]
MFAIPTQKNVIESASICLVALSLFLCAALVDFHMTIYSTAIHPEQHLVGIMGYNLAHFAFMLFGYGAYALPVCSMQLAILIHRTYQATSHGQRALFFIGLLLASLSSLGLCNALMNISANFPATSGGVIGFYIDNLCFTYLNTTGSILFLSTAFLVGVHMSTEIISKLSLSIVKLISYLNLMIKDYMSSLASRQQLCNNELQNEQGRVSDTPIDINLVGDSEEISNSDRVAPAIPKHMSLQSKKRVRQKKPKKPEMVIDLSKARPHQDPIDLDSVKQRPLETVKDSNVDADEPPLIQATPPLELLHKQTDGEEMQHDPKKVRELSEALERKLADFNVQCQVVNVQPGPVITRYELALAAGTKASKVSGLARDLARSLSIPSVRVVEVIPGKSTIGIEIPNFKRNTVGLRKLFESDRFQSAKSPLSLALGVDISGQPVVVDLAKMPHLLVAGTTGSGKSVGLNALLLSMLFRTSPEDLRLILIDPKMLEFAVYEGIPHLLTPVVTDMKDAASALHWCVNEMERRYKLMSDVGVRNITGYNTKLDEISKLGSYIGASGIEHQGHLPNIVVIADEFADMMMMVGKKVEQLIARLAQKARAAGIHLILATQRPSVDVITGLIKANIPTRLSFQVSSKIDSRTIIDQQGAEALLGAGDMLYLSPGSGVPLRAHGAYVSDEAVASVVAHLRKTAQPNYIEEITKTDIEAKEGSSSSRSDAGDVDPLFDEAVDIVVRTRKASISSVQRRLRIGYNRAACLIEKMEAEGIVSSTEATGQREVLAPNPEENR